MHPTRTQFLLEAFARATVRPHGYMVIDMKQNRPDILRILLKFSPFFPLPVGPAITLENGCTHGMK
jgi:hypothetical protein